MPVPRSRGSRARDAARPAGSALLTGDLGAALRYNALTVALLPFALWAAYVSLGHALGGPRLKVLRLSTAGTWAFAAVVAAWWVVRNLPMVPFSGLAPPT